MTDTSYTLLAHLSGGFAAGPENAATRALAYVVNRSSKAREALDEVIRSGVQGVVSIVKVRPQVAVRRGVIPDLVGDGEEDDGGKRRVRVMVEVKFGADLTDNQPVAYLQALTTDEPAVLLFLVPDERVGRLWPALRRRAEEAGMRPSEVDAERKCMRMNGSQRHLMVVGWTSLLDAVATRARDAGELGVEADVRQLRGLVQHVDPARDGDRYLRSVIESATDHGVQSGWLSTERLARVWRKSRYGRYVRFLDSGVTAWFGINYELAKKADETRLWLRFSPPAPKRGRVNQAQFDALREHCRTRGSKGYSWVPLDLKPDAEFSVVLDDVLDELQRISEVLSRVK